MTTPARHPSNPAALDQITSVAVIRWAYLRDAATDLALDDLFPRLEPGDPHERWRQIAPPEVIIAAMDREVRRYGQVIDGLRGDVRVLERKLRAVQMSARRLLAEADPATLAELRTAASA